MLKPFNLKAINGEIGMQGRHLQFTNYPLFMENRERGGYRVLHWISGQGGDQVLLPNLNHKDPVIRALMEDHRFRKALSLAIDRDELNEVGFFGVGTWIWQVVPLGRAGRRRTPQTFESVHGSFPSD